MKKSKVIKEFEKLNNSQKEEAFNYLQFILFKRKLINITDKFGNTHKVIPLSHFLK